MLSELPDDIIRLILYKNSNKEQLSIRLVCLSLFTNTRNNIHIVYFLENFIRSEFLPKQLFNKDNYLLRTRTPHLSIYKKLDTYDEHKGIHPSFYGGFYCANDCITQSCNEKRLERIYMTDLNNEKEVTTRYMPYCIICYLFIC